MRGLRFRGRAIQLPVRPLALAGVIVLAGCGPLPPLNVSMSQFPTNIIVGGPEATPSPTTSTAVPPPFQGVTVVIPSLDLSGQQDQLQLFHPPVAPLQGPAVPAIGSCGTSAFTHISEPVTPDAEYPPLPGNYRYRLTGNYDADGSHGTYPGLVSRTVENIRNLGTPPGGNTFGPAYSFDVTQRNIPDNGKFTTVSYQVTPTSTASYYFAVIQTNTGQSGDPAGVYITAISSNDPSSLTGGGGATGTYTFRPTPPIKLLPFPVVVFQKWTTQGTDSSSGSSISLSGSVDQSELVDACGKVLEAWQVHLTGSLTSVTRRGASLDLTYGVGTEYGGFILSEALVEAGSSNGLRDFLSETVSISQEPAYPPR